MQGVDTMVPFEHISELCTISVRLLERFHQ